MGVVSSYLKFNTKGRTDVIDITARISQHISKSRFKNGAVTLFVVGSTGGLTTIEYEPALVSDIREFFERIIPSNVPYEHDATWGDANGHSHLRASLIGPSLTVPFVDGSLALGTWQQIIFLDFDNRSRNRTIVVQVIGE